MVTWKSHSGSYVRIGMAEILHATWELHGVFNNYIFKSLYSINVGFDPLKQHTAQTFGLLHENFVCFRNALRST